MRQNSKDSSSRPLFTVLVPVYNHEKYIGTALDSILAQTDGDWEAVVVNDGSTDATPDIIEQYAERDHRIRTVHKENGGQPTALNAGLEHARGEWICWLSSDDMFDPGKLAVHREWIGRNPDCRFFYTELRILDEASGDIRDAGWGNVPMSREYRVLEQLESNHIPGISICVHRDVFECAGRFDERFRYAQDYDFYLRAFSHFQPVLIPRKTCTERQHSAQYTVRDRNTVTFECARVAIVFLNARNIRDFAAASEDSPLVFLERALDCAMNLNAAMYGMGFHPILISRILEWVLSQPAKATRKRLQHQFGVRARAAVAGAQRAEVAIIWRAASLVADCGAEGFMHEPTKPVHIARRSLCCRKGHPSEWADDLATYIDTRLSNVAEEGTVGENAAASVAHSKVKIDDMPVPGNSPSRRLTVLIFGDKYPTSSQLKNPRSVPACLLNNEALLITGVPQKLVLGMRGLVVGARRPWRALLCLASMPPVDMLLAPTGALELRLPLANRRASLQAAKDAMLPPDVVSAGGRCFLGRRLVRWVMCQAARLLRMWDRLSVEVNPY